MCLVIGLRLFCRWVLIFCNFISFVLGTEHEKFKNKYLEESELLKKKYLEECSERKQLYNEVIELKGNIRVFCRCRPLNQDEIANGSSSVVDFDSSQENELQIMCSDSSKKQFKFDHVFRPEDNQGNLRSDISLLFLPFIYDEI